MKKRYEDGGEIDAMEEANKRADRTLTNPNAKEYGEAGTSSTSKATPKAMPKAAPKPAAKAEATPAPAPKAAAPNAASVDMTKLSANERTKQQVEKNLASARSGSGSTDGRSVNERLRDSGIGSSISNYFSNFKTPAERKAQERKEKAAKGSYASGGSVSSASRRGDGIATKGKTRGKYI